jgi:NitT/TauT family transport system ATP-binding protein
MSANSMSSLPGRIPVEPNGHLAIDGVTKSFRSSPTDSRLILNQVTFCVRPGEFTVLFGPNAGGKTTLLKIIAGLITPDEGRVLLPKISTRIDMIFQNYRDSILPWKTVLENVAFPLELQGTAKSERYDRAIDVLRDVGADVLRETEFCKYPYQLSGGQQQLVAIARALVRNPDVLLLDESFAALDHDTRYRMQDILSRTWEARQFIALFVSHSVWEAVYMGDRVVLLSSRPARVVSEVEIPLSRPRRREVEYSQEFFDLRSKVLRVFEDQLYG